MELQNLDRMLFELAWVLDPAEASWSLLRDSGVSSQRGSKEWSLKICDASLCLTSDFSSRHWVKLDQVAFRAGCRQASRSLLSDTGVGQADQNLVEASKRGGTSLCFDGLDQPGGCGSFSRMLFGQRASQVSGQRHVSDQMGLA